MKMRWFASNGGTGVEIQFTAPGQKYEHRHKSSVGQVEEEELRKCE